MPGPRPPADDLINEFIFDKKCAHDKNYKEFWNWCRQGVGKFEAYCVNLSGATTNCRVQFEYNVNETQLPKPVPCPINATKFHESNIYGFANQTDKPSEAIQYMSAKLPTNIHYIRTCPTGPNCQKDEVQDGIKRLTDKRAQEIIDFCEYQINPGMSWWLIALIVLLTIGAVGSAFAAFWKYWLRRRLYGGQPGDQFSTMGSSYTSAPISSVSNQGYASGGAGSRAASSMLPNLPAASRLASERSGSLNRRDRTTRSDLSSRSRSRNSGTSHRPYSTLISRASQR